ncbi:sigma-70 family RNA polymerase sigma factor [Saccharothrix sp. 6-C]|uniref:sigma-70 family RNA polymerase sigma factor n=1 Tax=Saccharothrix sp. 6-C TaxID=2781735 RepID=UPI001917799C|nr:sigma-70 family RNA polymerase sigma factor [Saccharothrix sp. 6-C]QQQ75684.1 sigma-70 family RNA polymerase sigma factor [Saccharothrix sp. 6-C]
MAERCEGPEWRRFTRVLSEYGFASMMGWLRSGLIFTLCREKGRPVGVAPPYWEHDDLVSLAGDTVVRAIGDFRRNALLAGGWDPAGGASLKTYFATACVLAFPNVYRKWSNERRHRDAEHFRLSSVDELADVASPAPDPGDVVVTKLEIKRGLADIPSEYTKSALILSEAGYTLGEVAELLNTTHGVIKGALERHRRNTGRPARGGGDNV